MRYLKRERLVRLGTVGLCAVLLAVASGMLVVDGQPAEAAAKTSKVPVTPKVVRRGQTWDSIKAMPNWTGMWTPGRPPEGTAAPAGFGGAGAIFGAGVPLTPKYSAIRDARMLRVRGDGPGGVADIPLSNSGFCLPNGTPHNMTPVSHEYLFSPGRVTILLENSEIRRIWTDGRGHVPVEEANPSFSGDSVGHWEGDTLVVETTDIYPEAELFIGQDVTEKTVVKERITRVKDKMRIDTVVEDPDLFTKPWVYTLWFDREDRLPVDYESCTKADRAKLTGERLGGIDFNPNRPLSGDHK